MPVSEVSAKNQKQETPLYQSQQLPFTGCTVEADQDDLQHL
jgi:hypothetical protein